MIAVTFFKDHTAGLKRLEQIELEELARQIEEMVAPAKAKLPWLKFARFGDRRSDKGSLRHDANVLCISGVEGDYDGEQITFDEAVAIAEQAAVQCILYTSPSHTPERPRWRILCPTSQELPPETRANLVARVNGVFGGALAVESFTLSQSYYYGKVAGAPDHRVKVLDGTPVDLLEDLDRIAIAKPNGSAGGQGSTASTSPFDEAAIAEQITSGASYHTAAVRLVGKWAQGGVPFLDAQRKLEALFDAVFPPERDDRWQARRNEIPRIIRDIYGKDAAQADNRTNGQAGDTQPQQEQLRQQLDINSWATLEIAPEPRLLGDLITPSTRMFLVGRTGLGKTLLAHAMAGGMASGQGFLEWRAERPSRWLVIDGEMPTGLIKARAADLIRRVGTIPPGNLIIYSTDRAEEFARQIPGLGMMEPINTAAGQQFVIRLITAVGAEGVIFDNVMSLIAGDQKDEIPWSQTVPLVASLSKLNVAQVYLDHTGHNSDRQYGSTTKAWRMDTVGMMTPLPDEQRRHGEVAFTLSFEPPGGKARRRTPDNLKDFETTIVRLTDDRWTCEPTGRQQRTTKLSPVATLWHQALLDALCHSDTPGRTTRTAWFGEAVRTSLADAVAPTDERRSKDRQWSKLRKYAIELRAAGLIGVDGETVIDLRKSA